MLTEVTARENLAIVKDSLFKFILARIPDANVSLIDDIMLSYVYGTFETSTDDFYTQLGGK